MFLLLIVLRRGSISPGLTEASGEISFGCVATGSPLGI